MKKVFVAVVLAFVISMPVLKAQFPAGPFILKNSAEFKSFKGHKILAPLGYGNDGIIQVSGKKVESFSLQKFSSQLVFEKENNVITGNKLPEDASYERMVRTKNKTYLFVKNNRKGIAALEFFPDKLDFATQSVPLFESSNKIRAPRVSDWAWEYGTLPVEGVNTPKMYNFVLSEDKTKFLYSYSLMPKIKRDKINKDVIGLYVYDENLNKILGGEYTMPYTEAKMDNLGYTLSNDGKVYLLAKVYGNEDRIAAAKKDVAAYHYEVLVYEKDNPTVKAIELKLDNYFPQEAFIYEDLNHNIVIAGFYSKAEHEPIDGAYMVKLAADNSTLTRVNGGFYEIPSDVIKAYASEREKRKFSKKEKKGQNIGIRDLKIRSITTTPDGSVKIVSEQYRVVRSYVNNNYAPYGMGSGFGVGAIGGASMYSYGNSRTEYDIYADDIFVFSIDSQGKLEWVKKIPKAQRGHDKTAAGLSLVTSYTGNDVNLFYMDNIKNDKLSESQSPYVHQDNRGGYLTGVKIDPKGTVSKYNLGSVKTYKTNFYIRYFVDGGKDNLISTERKKKKNILFSIEAN